MTQFKLTEIIASYKLDKYELAKVLFPGAKYPKMALTRVLKGEASLSVDQLEILADFIGVTPSQLFMLDTWKDITTTEDLIDNCCLTLEKGAYKVKLNFDGAFLTLYKDGEVVYRQITGTDTPVKKFIEYLDDLITKY